MQLKLKVCAGKVFFFEIFEAKYVIYFFTHPQFVGYPENRWFFILFLAKLGKNGRAPSKKSGRTNFHIFQNRLNSSLVVHSLLRFCNFCDIFSKDQKSKSSLGMLTKSRRSFVNVAKEQKIISQHNLYHSVHYGHFFEFFQTTLLSSSSMIFPIQL